MEEETDMSLWYAELAKYYELSNASFTESLAILSNNIDVVKQDVSAPKALVALYNLNGEYDEAIQFLNTHHFRTWEGGQEIYCHYVDTHTLKAIELINDKEYESSITHLDSALLYPENLEVGKASDGERNALIYYYLGEAYTKMGKSKKARESYQKSVASEN
ncbi:MAG: tetratricopeptide repeat protein [Bacteroidota bacterium]